MNGFRPLRNDFVSASDQNTAKFTSKKIRCFGLKVHGKLRLRGRIRSSSQSISYFSALRTQNVRSVLRPQVQIYVLKNRNQPNSNRASPETVGTLCSHHRVSR